jgi:holliday junction DNA helicase RuvA
VLELRDKLADFGAVPEIAAVSPVEEDVISALVNLGYQRPAAERALAVATRGLEGKGTFDTLFRDVLGALSK